ncbi:hypothetical protein ACFX5U_08590 [Sphingobacterium sp. SG20118]|uniref:hypothetical protein n=1 Tax=Sphingobacterium sp. SG20118 TaxID=3367156 RepID=UPI0037DFC20F
MKKPSILSEIKYIPQNYLSKLAEPENKKGNELLKLVRGLLLEDEDSNLLYNEFKSRLKSNDLERESIINNYFEIRDQIALQKVDLIQRGDKTVLQTNVETNEAKIKNLNEKAGLSPKEINEYGILSKESEQIELEITKIRSDYGKVFSFNTNTKNTLDGLIQKKIQLLASIENKEIGQKLKVTYKVLDNAFEAIEKLIAEIKLDDNRRFIAENIFKDQFQQRGKRSSQLRTDLKPFLQNEVIKKEIEGLEILVTSDKQKINGINQLTIEIGKNSKAMEVEKVKLFNTFKRNFEEYDLVISDLKERAEMLENDNLKIIGTPKYNFSKMRERIFQRTDGRKLNSERFNILDPRKNNLEIIEIDQIVSDLKIVFESMVEKEDYPFVSKADLKETVKTLLYDYFFDYWDVIYDDDELKKMSTGKASFVILMLIVGLSKSKSPILIDQPEDNLDNRSITKNLVEYLRNKKLERQIILVTHNANVVVNADAENVIVANQKGQNDKETTSPYQFDYINGSIENSVLFDINETDLLKSMGIKEHIADIVEGGEEAFKKRERKYGFRTFNPAI